MTKLKVNVKDVLPAIKLKLSVVTVQSLSAKIVWSPTKK